MAYLGPCIWSLSVVVVGVAFVVYVAADWVDIFTGIVFVVQRLGYTDDLVVSHLVA